VTVRDGRYIHDHVAFWVSPDKVTTRRETFDLLLSLKLFLFFGKAMVGLRLDSRPAYLQGLDWRRAECPSLENKSVTLFWVHGEQIAPSTFGFFIFDIVAKIARWIDEL
jgi:hypothetical protein